MARSPHPLWVTLELWEQQSFSSLSSTAKRLLVAKWVNHGKRPHQLPRLTSAEQSRFLKIVTEDGFEVLQDVVATAEDREAGRK